MNIEEQVVEHLRLHLIQVIKENQFNLQHPRVIEMSEQLDTLIEQYYFNNENGTSRNLNKPDIATGR